MTFECTQKRGKEEETWLGHISRINDYGSHIEIYIQSRSSIMVLIGKTSQGNFACIPDFNAGCHLVDLNDLFWNSERLRQVLGQVDGITVATALYAYTKKLCIDSDSQKASRM